MRIYYFLILYLLNSCAIGGSNLSSIDRAEEFFLCFPETDNNYLILPLEKKASIQKEIINRIGKGLKRQQCYEEIWRKMKTETLPE